MNAYGSEGPGRRISGKRNTQHATTGLYDLQWDEGLDNLRRSMAANRNRIPSRKSSSASDKYASVFAINRKTEHNKGTRAWPQPSLTRLLFDFMDVSLLQPMRSCLYRKKITDRSSLTLHAQLQCLA